jgi:hypothetical protein
MNRTGKTIFGSVIVGVLFTPVAILLAFISAGAGHGNYVWARVFFPYSILLTNATGSITTSLMVLAVMQFPLYGLVCGVGFSASKRIYPIVAATAHLAAVIATFLGAVSLLR